jgi:hypothetical protein
MEASQPSAAGPAVDQARTEPKKDSTQPQPVVIGLLAAPGISATFAEELRAGLPDILHERFPKSEWKVENQVEPLAGPPGTDVDLVQLARRRMLDRGWNIAVVLTDLPIHVGHRPVTAHVSVTLGVGVVSVPALGPIATENLVRQTVLRVIEGLIAETARGRKRVTTEIWRRPGLRARLSGLAHPVGTVVVPQDDTVQFVTDTAGGNLRLVIGMVRANRPWHLIAGLSRALVAALGAAAFTLTSPGVWRIANGLSWPRLLILCLGAIAGTCLLLITVHGLLEQLPQQAAARQRVLLFNLATTLTIALGVVTHYLALFVISLLAGAALIAPQVFGKEIGHAVGLTDYIRLAWLVTTLGTIGGALGAAVESDRAVREAAYGYRPEERRPTDTG